MLFLKASFLLEGFFYLILTIGFFVFSYILFYRDFVYFSIALISSFMTLILSIALFYEHLQIKNNDDADIGEKKNNRNTCKDSVSTDGDLIRF